jgi:hypothetical protein
MAKGYSLFDPSGMIRLSRINIDGHRDKRCAMMTKMERVQLGNPIAQESERQVTTGVSWTMLLAGVICCAAIGTWLVWFSFVIQRQHNEADIRAACQRLMSETVERCVDTVVIQRGGMRR